MRLLAVTEVTIDGTVVIEKGALAQATVMSVWFTDKRNDLSPGLSLKLDWVRSINGLAIPLRTSKNGKPRKIKLQVLSSPGGAIACPENFKHVLISSLTLHMSEIKTAFHEKDWVPPGTRITAFVHGAADLDAAELKEAQTRLPLHNPTVSFTIYRAKDANHDSATVLCDGKPTPGIAARQYVILELEPGSHSCLVESGAPVELITEAGEEYFLRVRPRTLSAGWELKRVSEGEGEDGIAQGRMVVP